jgi:hypothetical protein
MAQDLRTEFPGIAGFSPRSLKYVRSFAAAWQDESVVQQVAAQLQGNDAVVNGWRRMSRDQTYVNLITSNES